MVSCSWRTQEKENLYDFVRLKSKYQIGIDFVLKNRLDFGRDFILERLPQHEKGAMGYLKKGAMGKERLHARVVDEDGPRNRKRKEGHGLHDHLSFMGNMKRAQRKDIPQPILSRGY
jgi:hypothetical protein